MKERCFSLKKLFLFLLGVVGLSFLFVKKSDKDFSNIKETLPKIKEKIPTVKLELTITTGKEEREEEVSDLVEEKENNSLLEEIKSSKNIEKLIKLKEEIKSEIKKLKK